MFYKVSCAIALWLVCVHCSSGRGSIQQVDHSQQTTSRQTTTSPHQTDSQTTSTQSPPEYVGTAKRIAWIHHGREQDSFNTYDKEKKILSSLNKGVLLSLASDRVENFFGNITNVFNPMQNEGGLKSLIEKIFGNIEAGSGGNGSGLPDIISGLLPGLLGQGQNSGGSFGGILDLVKTLFGGSPAGTENEESLEDVEVEQTINVEPAGTTPFEGDGEVEQKNNWNETIALQHKEENLFELIETDRGGQIFICTFKSKPSGSSCPSQDAWAIIDLDGEDVLIGEESDCKPYLDICSKDRFEFMGHFRDQVDALKTQQ